eukprot:6177487-Ditylum_brightwellii.AAC.1
MEEVEKEEITLWVSPNATGSDAKNNVTKICVAKLKSGNPEELINWRIWLNHVIWNKAFLDEEDEESGGEDRDDKEKEIKDKG